MAKRHKGKHLSVEERLKLGKVCEKDARTILRAFASSPRPDDVEQAFACVRRYRRKRADGGVGGWPEGLAAVEQRLYGRQRVAAVTYPAEATALAEQKNAPAQGRRLRLRVRELEDQNASLKKKAADEGERADDQGTTAMYLTAQKSELQQLVSDAANALIDAGVPTHECPDGDTPFYYMLESHRDDGKQTVLWNPHEGRPMTLAEGIHWLLNQRELEKESSR